MKNYFERYERERLKEKFLMSLVWLLPRELVYLAVVRVAAYATVGKYSKQVVPELTVMDALKRWQETPCQRV